MIHSVRIIPRKVCSLSYACRSIISALALASTLAVTASDLPQPVAVDLSLSVEWANANLGAASSAEPGNYYAFGETYTKESYHWDTYTHCDDGDMTQIHDFGTDNISGTEFDAARTLLGNGWRIPTIEEFRELINECTLEITSEGISFTAANGNSIFIPAGGYMNKLRNITPKMVYLSTSACSTETEEWAGSVYRMTNSYVFVINGTTPVAGMMSSVQLGMPIRPVRDSAAGAAVLPGKDAAETPVEYYNLQGIRVNEPAHGIYILRRGASSAVVRL